MAATSQFHYDSKSQRYFIEGPVGLKNARLGIEVDGSMHWGDEAEQTAWSDGEARFEFAAPPLGWKVRFEWLSGRPALLISSTIENRGKQLVKLGRCRLADTTKSPGEVRFGPHPAQAATLIIGGYPPLQIKRLSQAEGMLTGKTLTQWFTPGSGPSLQFAFTSFDRAETVIESGWDKERQLPVVSAWNDFAGFELPPEASVNSEVLRIGLEADSYAAFDAWADAAYKRYHPPIWSKIPAGWVGGAWVDPIYTELDEDVVHRNIRAVRNRLKLDENHIQYVWVSLGNLKDILPGNWLNWNYDRFPSGPEALHQELESLKFRWGLWAGFFWLSSRLTAQVEQLKDALLQYRGKPLTIPHRDLGVMYVLDPTHPKTQEYIREVFSTWRRWGVRYYMLDFLDAVSGANPGTHPNDSYFDKSKIPGPEAWREGLRMIRETVTDDTYLLGSTSPTLQVVGWVNGQHLGSDYGDGRPLYGPGKGFYPGTFVINKPDWWTSHRPPLMAMAAYSFVNRKLYIADTASVLTLDKPIPLADAQIVATIFGINGGQLMLGDDVERMDEERLRMIRLVFPRLPEAARALDLFDSAELDYPQVFHLKVEREWDNWDLLAVFNLGEHTLFKTLPLERLGLDPKASYAVFDFWNLRFQGVQSTGAVSVEVPPDSVKLLRIARDREHPWLLSTDMHVRQGQAEILDCKWDEDAMTLTIRTQRPAGHEGSIYAHAPKGWVLAEPKGLWLARDGRDNSLVIRKALAFEGEPVEVKMHFKRYTV
jgi:hypothetical protein